MAALKLIQPGCDLCGSRAIRPLWALRFESYPGPFRLWRCGHCGVAFNWPRLPPEAIGDQYDSDYYIFTLPPARRWARATQLYIEHLLPLERMWETGNEPCFDRLDPSRDRRGAGFAEAHQPLPDGRGSDGKRRRLLEVGCAQGDLLAIARARGWDVHGIEISPEPARRAAEHGLPVSAGTLEDGGAAMGSFDVAIATDVIEHVVSPRRFLCAMRAVLRPGGRAVIDTPNLDGLWSRLGGRRWIGFNRFHLFLFGAGSLARLMRSCGFRDCRASSSTHCAHMRWGERPELAGIIESLPAGLQWRSRRGLNRLSPAGRLPELRQKPPVSLADALERIQSLGAAAPAPRPRRLSGDNLAVVGRA